MMLDLSGRLEQAVAALSGAMPESGPAPLRMLQAYASMLARQGRHRRRSRTFASSSPIGASCPCSPIC